MAPHPSAMRTPAPGAPATLRSRKQKDVLHACSWHYVAERGTRVPDWHSLALLARRHRCHEVARAATSCLNASAPLPSLGDRGAVRGSASTLARNWGRKHLADRLD